MAGGYGSKKKRREVKDNEKRNAEKVEKVEKAEKAKRQVEKAREEIRVAEADAWDNGYSEGYVQACRDVAKSMDVPSSTVIEWAGAGKNPPNSVTDVLGLLMCTRRRVQAARFLRGAP